MERSQLKHELKVLQEKISEGQRSRVSKKELKFGRDFKEAKLETHDGKDHYVIIVKKLK